MPRVAEGIKLRSIGADVLRALKAKGVESDILDGRLDFADKSQLLNHFMTPMSGIDRVHCGILPTQSSGRWSFTEPPITTFPAKYRDVVMPDLGTFWVVWDWDAIEARIIACYANDVEDLDAFKLEHDIHTITCCGVFKYPKPPSLVSNTIHFGDDCAEWRAARKWEGKDDRRRVLSKVVRYALQYGKNYRAVMSVKNFEKLGISMPELLKVAKAYWFYKRALLAFKQRTWRQVWDTHEARTFLGRRRRLFGLQEDVEKQGLNHMIQGAVADIMNLTLIAIFARWPESWLAYQSHDSGKIAFPVGSNPWPDIKNMVEMPYEIAGITMPFTAEWHVVTDTGEDIKGATNVARHFEEAR